MNYNCANNNCDSQEPPILRILETVPPLVNKTRYTLQSVNVTGLLNIITDICYLLILELVLESHIYKKNVLF